MTNEHLPDDPQELKDIARIREALFDTDRDDHLAILNDWEKRVKKALIMLNLRKNEGIQVILRMAEETIRGIDQELEGRKPKSLSPDDALEFAHETLLLHERRAMWEQFMRLFVDSEEDLEEIRSDIKLQLEEENLGEEEADAPEPPSDEDDEFRGEGE